LVERADGDGYTAATALQRKTVSTTCDFMDGIFCQIVETEYLLQQVTDEVARDRRRIARSPGGIEFRPQSLGDAPVAADLVTELETAGDIVVGRGLLPGLERSDPGQPFGREQPAFDAQRFEFPAGILSASHSPTPGEGRR